MPGRPADQPGVRHLRHTVTGPFVPYDGQPR